MHRTYFTNVCFEYREIFVFNEGRKRYEKIFYNYCVPKIKVFFIGLIIFGTFKTINFGMCSKKFLVGEKYALIAMCSFCTRCFLYTKLLILSNLFFLCFRLQNINFNSNFRNVLLSKSILHIRCRIFRKGNKVHLVNIFKTKMVIKRGPLLLK